MLEEVKSIVYLLVKRPITETIALEINQLDGFKHLEIINGEWAGFEEDAYMTGEEHGWIESKLLLMIGNHVLTHNLGRVYPGDMDFVLVGDVNDIRLKRKPDVAFVSSARLQKTLGYFYGAPDLAVEIVSPSQNRPEMVSKANEYLMHGAKQAWLVFPAKHTIEVHTDDTVPDVYHEGDMISNNELLPGLTIEVDKVFSE